MAGLFNDPGYARFVPRLALDRNPPAEQPAGSKDSKKKDSKEKNEKKEQEESSLAKSVHPVTHVVVADLASKAGRDLWGEVS